MLPLEARGGVGQIQLDHFRGTRANEEQSANIRASFQQLGYHAIQFFMTVGHASQVTLPQNGGRETRFCKNHHARGRLEKMRTGA